MSRVRKSSVVSKSPAAEEVDLREQPFNRREIGPIEAVQLPTDNITSLHGIFLDLDLHLFRRSELTAGAEKGPKTFFKQTVGQWLTRHPVLAGAEVRSTGCGLHVIVWFAEPLDFEADCDRQRWAGIVKVVQGILPIDPDQPGITALTRPIDSVNGKSGRAVACLRPGTPVPVADVLQLFDQMVRSPFRTVMGTLLGADRVSPCPVCRGDGTSLSALDHVGRCYGSCGTVKLEQLYDLYLAPREIKGKEAADG